MVSFELIFTLSFTPDNEASVDRLTSAWLSSVNFMLPVSYLIRKLLPLVAKSKASSALPPFVSNLELIAVLISSQNWKLSEILTTLPTQWLATLDAVPAPLLVEVLFTVTVPAEAS